MTSVAHPPRLTTETAAQIAEETFGVAGTISALPSERDQNFKILRADGAAFVLKIANAHEARQMLEAENAVVRHLAPTGAVPDLVPTLNGDDIGRAAGHFVRLITWLDGQPLGMTRPQTDALLTDLGRVLGTIDHAFARFDHPALHRMFHWDLVGAPALVRARLPLVHDDVLGGALTTFLNIYDEHVTPRLPSLRRGVIHGDANDYNVLVDRASQRVIGLVDFGDMVVSHVVNDVAIAMAYAALGKPDPLGAAALVLHGYQAVHPLTDSEIATVFALMGMRLCLSVVVAVSQQRHRPDDAYLGISQHAIRETLPALAAIHPRLAHYRLRDACGLSPVPATPKVISWLRANAGQFAPVTGHDLRTARVLGLDLSAGSPLVSSNPAENAAEPLARRLFEAMREAGTKVGAGGYNEARLIYASENYATGAVTDERRTIHIGLDLTLPAGSPIFAPLDGIVHGLEDAGRFDYGPVVVLRHDISGEEPVTFYTLYGHLTRESLKTLAVGQAIRSGERFAAIGPAPENGDWWPHLHFQVIVDMLDVPVNFNGVALASQRQTWLSLSPDPNLILGIPPERFPKHQSAHALLVERRSRFGANLTLSYLRPLTIVRGWMQYLFDDTGRAYVDAFNNVAHVGHAHPAVTRAVAAQLATLNTNTRYLHELATTYAAELTAQCPSPLSICFFTASGSEANELALRLARAHTRRRDLIVMESAYHGHTTTLIDISPYKHAGPGGEGAPDWVHTSPIPDVYRGAHRAGDPLAGAKYAKDVGEVIERLQDRGGVCAYLAETCPSVGGQIFMPPAFLPEVYRLVRDAGGVCIADEVQTGFGRLGTHFWAFEAHGVVPDILVLGKPIANGYPMGAVITTPEIAASFDNGMEFFSTFGGSTAACAAGLSTLRTTLAEGLQAHALEVGSYLLGRLHALQDRHALVGDVRGSGLFAGVELVKDRQTREPATADAAVVVNRMRDLHVLVGTDGPHHNVIKIRGPMPLIRQDIDRLVSALDQALLER